VPQQYLAHKKKCPFWLKVLIKLDLRKTYGILRTYFKAFDTKIKIMKYKLFQKNTSKNSPALPPIHLQAIASLNLSHLMFSANYAEYLLQLLILNLFLSF
jgi:hypothetical protein